MSQIEHENGTAILRRSPTKKPKRSFRSWFIGRPLSTADAPHQTIGKAVGLAVFAADAMSSTAYATQEILVILVLAGTAAFVFAFPIAIAITALLIIVTLSYEQTIHAYPGGGGSYIVARDNLGELPAQTAGASLLTDYVLTVAVSISSGVAQIVSAIPEVFPYRVMLSIGLIFFVMVINLRGVKESGAFFAVPSYYFIVMMYIMVGVGLFRYVSGSMGTVVDPPPLELIHQTQAISLFLILRAFSSGTSAMTGVEAISNGIMAFKEPRSHNAGVTLIIMSTILGSLLLGITFLSGNIGVIPSETETVISQLARTTFGGRGIPYILAISSTSLILILAANTAFADFPRLSAIMAADGFLPRQLAYRGSRLVYSRGIIALAAIAALLVLVFRASVNGLIPLYAIGVFLSFTLSQAGMAHRWWKSGRLQPGQDVKERGSTLRFEKSWKLKMVVNGFGSVCTAVVVVVFCVTKFPDGAWIIVILVPSLVAIFSYIHGHYRRLAAQLSLEKYGAPPTIVRHRVILPIAGVHRGTLDALRYARTLSDDITAVHVSIDPADAERVQEKWEMWGDGVRLLILESPYRLMLEPLLDYIEEMAAKRQANETITIVVPEFVPKHWWNNALHARTASLLRSVLVHQPGIMIIDVPYQVE